MRCIDIAQEERQLSDAEREWRKRIKLRCLGLASLERTIARQRVRVRYLAERDANTAYFHLIAHGRKRKNYIPSLTVNGRVVTEHDGMEMALFDYFSAVFGTAATN